MSDNSSADAAAVAIASSPEFDKRELDQFGRDDGHAVAAITRMLIIFFFYSLVIMGAVTLWTWLWAR